MTSTNRFLSTIKKAQKIVISTHIHPDADGIGSEIALAFALTELGKDVICVNEEKLLQRYKYLDPEDLVISHDEYAQNRNLDKKIDLFIVVDTNSLKRIGEKSSKIAESAQDLLFIDHHPCSENLESKNCIDTTKAATGELVGQLIESLGIKLNEKIALALYTSILIDTSSFRYPTVSADTHRMIGKLMDSGVKPPHAYNQIYGTKPLSYLRALGRILHSVESTEDERVAWLAFRESDLEKFNVDSEDTHGFINHLLILDKTQVACMFRQINGSVKLSLRAVDQNVDVGIIAEKLGGGGHQHSAATIFQGDMQKVIEQTVPKIEKSLNSQNP